MISSSSLAKFRSLLNRHRDVGREEAAGRIKGVTEPQEAAAAKYRLLHDRAQIGGARAIDHTAVRVDTSGQADVCIAEIGDDTGRQYKDAVRYLGMNRSSLVERIVVYDQ